jgi:RNA polymerase sigma factor (sigma-70 family)
MKRFEANIMSNKATADNEETILRYPTPGVNSDSRLWDKTGRTIFRTGSHGMLEHCVYCGPSNSPVEREEPKIPCPDSLSKPQILIKTGSGWRIECPADHRYVIEAGRWGTCVRRRTFGGVGVLLRERACCNLAASAKCFLSMLTDQKTSTPFTQTHWSLIIAVQAGDANAQRALGDLCQKYWYPLYAFVRRSGKSPHEAEDLVQGFFCHLLQRPWLDGVGPEKGRFRTYLIRCLTNYVRNEWNKEQAARRHPPGGIFPLEMSDGETHYEHEPIDEETPDKLFERRWVAALVEQAKIRLRVESERDGKLALFEALEPHLGGRVEHGILADLAARLGMSEESLRVALHRLRKRFGEILREVVAETVADPAELDEEIRHLFSAWG